MRDNVKGGALTEVSFYILLAVFTPRHGYAIMQFIKEKTNGRLSLGAGTLYGALNTLQEKGWIKSLESERERKKEFVITDNGKIIAQGELERLNNLLNLAAEILGESP